MTGCWRETDADLLPCLSYVIQTSARVHARSVGAMRELTGCE
jgi:hypothetical protein